jgi:hypothetical protein
LSQIDTIPTPSDISAPWLSALLGRAVSGVSAKTVGTGQVGATYRFDLIHTNAQSGQPNSLIGKFMSDDPTSRATGIAQLSYVREVNFYRHYGSGNGLPIPACHFAVIDPETHEFALIMEDFPHHRSGNQLEPATLAEAELAMHAAARIHAPFWHDDSLDQHGWLNGSKAVAPMNVDGLYAMLWPAFRDRYGPRLSDEIKSAGEGYLGQINAWIARRPGPRCLTHGDFRPDNMLFLDGANGTPLVIVDWQTAGVGNGATDIAYYLGTALHPDLRRTHERALVERWIVGLIESGVPEADTRQLWDAYRREAVAGFLMGVLASMIVVQTQRGDAMFLEMCARSAYMIQDHKSLELI